MADEKTNISFTDSAGLIGTNILTDDSIDKNVAFHSRMEKSIIQPKEKPAEDVSRLRVEVDIDEVDNGTMLHRKSIDLLSGEVKFVEKLPKTIGTDILYSCSTEMDNIVRQKVATVQRRIPKVVSGFSSIKFRDGIPNGIRTVTKNSPKVKRVTLKTVQKQEFRVSEIEKEKEYMVEKETLVNSETKKSYKIQAAVQRRFSRKNRQMWEDMCSAGHVIISTVADELTPEEDEVVEAYQVGKKSLSNISEVLDFTGARNIQEMILDKATCISDISAKTEKLINSGTLMLSELSLSKDELNGLLKERGLSKNQRKSLWKNKEAVKNVLESKQILLDFATNSYGKVSDDLVNFLQGKEIFNNQLFEKEFIRVASQYFASSLDPLFKAINPTNMSSSELKSLIKKAEKMDINSRDVVILKELLRNKLAEKAKEKTAFAIGVQGRITQLSKAFGEIVDKFDNDAATVGFRQTGMMINVGDSAFRMLMFQAKITKSTMLVAGRGVFLNPASRFVGRKIKQELTVAKNTTKTAINSTETVKKIGKAAEDTKRVVGQNKKIQILKQKADSIKTVATTVKHKTAHLNNKRKRINRKIKSAKNKAMRVVKKPIKVTFAITSIFYRVKEFLMKKMLLPIAGAILVLLLIYTLLIAIASVMLNNSTDDYLEYENLVDDMWEGMVPIITVKESDIYHTIYSTDKYPLDGSAYYCNDSDFYMEYNGAKEEGVCFYDTIATKNLSTPIVTGYSTLGKGCQYNQWYEWGDLICNQIQHTHGRGCNYTDCIHNCGNNCVNECIHQHTSFCCSKSYHEHTTENGCYEKNWYREYYCSGHTALHCSYGYRDINIYVTLLSKDDVFQGVTDSEKTVMTYLVPTDFAGNSMELKTATMEYKNGYRRRLDNFIHSGYWDSITHQIYAIYNASTGSMSCDIPSINDNGGISTGASSDKRCNGNIEWCNELYASDWYELYGVQLYMTGTEIGVDYVLSDEEIDTYLKTVIEQFSAVSDSRLEFIKFALENVGAISYWYGGKPSSADWDEAWGTIAPISDPYYEYNLGKGRTIYGLDCSGFVGWCYWVIYGIQPNCSTAGFVDSLGLNRISFRNLQPGDIGIENAPGTAQNYIGIFIGYDEKGRAVWVHCNAGTNNVAVNNTNCFKWYYSIE